MAVQLVVVWQCDELKLTGKCDRNPPTGSDIHVFICFSGPRLFTRETLFSVREWLHLWQVWVCLEWIGQVRFISLHPSIHPSVHPSIHPCIYLSQQPHRSPLLLLSVIMTGSYNNFFRMFDRNTKRDVTLEASRENSKPRAILKPRKVQLCSSAQVTWYLEVLCLRQLVFFAVLHCQGISTREENLRGLHLASNQYF